MAGLIYLRFSQTHKIGNIGIWEHCIYFYFPSLFTAYVKLYPLGLFISNYEKEGGFFWHS